MTDSNGEPIDSQLRSAVQVIAEAVAESGLRTDREPAEHGALPKTGVYMSADCRSFFCLAVVVFLHHLVIYYRLYYRFMYTPATQLPANPSC